MRRNVKVVQSKDFDAENMTDSGAPFVLENGAVGINPKYSVPDGKVKVQEFQLQTPLMKFWPAKEKLTAEKQPTGKYVTRMQFPQPLTEETEQFLDVIKAVEKKCFVLCAKHAATIWPGKSMTAEKIAEFKYDNPMLRYGYIKDTKIPDMTKSPSLGLRFQQRKKAWSTEIYQSGSNPPEQLYKYKDESSGVPYTFFGEPHVYGRALITPTIWIVGGGVSIVWELNQAMLDPSDEEATPAGCQMLIDGVPVAAAAPAAAAVAAPAVDVADASFLDDEAPIPTKGKRGRDDEDAEPALKRAKDPVPAPAPVPEPAPAPAPAAAAEDSDSDEEPLLAPAPVPVPAPAPVAAPKKKIVIKKSAAPP